MFQQSHLHLCFFQHQPCPGSWNGLSILAIRRRRWHPMAIHLSVMAFVALNVLALDLELGFVAQQPNVPFIPGASLVNDPGTHVFMWLADQEMQRMVPNHRLLTQDIHLATQDFPPQKQDITPCSFGRVQKKHYPKWSPSSPESRLHRFPMIP